MYMIILLCTLYQIRVYKLISFVQYLYLNFFEFIYIKNSYYIPQQ
jgi:hypothetical protein